MKRRCTIRDLSKHLNISTSTISRVLNNKKSNIPISATTRQKILQGAKELNYVPNINAKRLFSQRTNSICLLTPAFRKMGKHSFEDNNLVAMITGMEEELTKRGYSLLLMFKDDKFIEDKRYLTIFQEGNVDGILIWGTTQDEDYVQELAAEKWPYLLLNSLPQTYDNLNYIVHDDFNSSKQVTEHLIKQGHRDFAFIRGKEKLSITEHQENGFRSTLEEAGLPFDEQLIAQGDFSTESGIKAAEHLLTTGKQFTAIVSSNYCMAAGALDYVEKQTDTPSSIVVASCRGARDDKYLPPFPVAQIDSEEMGRKAFTTLLDLIDKNITQPVNTLMKSKLKAPK